MVSVVDLFAGPGGLGEGFSSVLDEEGNNIFQIIMSVEMEQSAHSTLRLRSFLRKVLNGDGTVPNEYIDYIREPTDQMLENLIELHRAEWEMANSEALHAKLVEGDNTLAIEAKERLEKTTHDAVVLIGGPPCQAYSLAGRSRRTNDKEGLEADEKQTLYKCYLDFIREVHPDVFVMENVQGILTARHRGHGVFERIISDMKGLGYSVRSLAAEDAKRPADYVVHAERYGVPQARRRVILLGVKADSKTAPGTLRETCWRATVGDAMAGLPKLRSGFSLRDERQQDEWASFIRESARELIEDEQVDEKTRVEFRHLMRGRMPPNRSASKVTYERGLYDNWYRGALGSSRVLTRHDARTHSGDDLKRYLFCSSFAKVNGRSPNLYDFPDALIPPHKNAQVLKTDRTASVAFADRYRTQVADQPSTTITSHIRKDGHYYIHPDPRQCRSLTVREAARLQTFPDDYFFIGNRTAQYQQVGNAVPPMLAQQIAVVVARYLGYDCESFIGRMQTDRASAFARCDAGSSAG